MSTIKRRLKSWIRCCLFSVRFKMMSLYLIILTVMLLVILFGVPKWFQSYLLERSEDSLRSTRKIIQETLEETDFQTNSQLRDRLNAVAEAREIEIWICMAQVDGPAGSPVIPVFRFGENLGKEEVELPTTTADFIESVRSGMVSEDIYFDLFPEYFAQRTISMVYTTHYYGSRTLESNGTDTSIALTEAQTGVILLNIALQDISEEIAQMMNLVLATFGIIALLAAFVIWYMTSKMMKPVQEMREIADLIAQGDFSKKVENMPHDEIGDLGRAFNTMAVELQEVEQSRQAFIANVSHDFRSPLTSIRGFVQAMLDDVIPVESYPKYLKIVFDETNRLSKLTNDLLTLSKMESGQVELNRQRFDINESILKLVINFEQRIEEKKIQMDFRFLEEKLYVYADPDQIMRVIYNLVDNAIKFTETGDSITIETSIVNHKAFVSVEDTGIGMDEEAQRHVFDRFHKGDSSRGLNKTGMGLGLAIVKQIILNHEEKITVSSSPNVGTKFEFTLPLAPHGATEVLEACKAPDNSETALPSGEIE